MGGGLAVAAIVRIVAIGFGGSTPDAKKPAPQAALAEGSQTAKPAVTPAMGSADQLMAGSGSATTGGSGSADVAAGSAAGSESGSGSAVADTGSGSAIAGSGS